ncbi:MAG: hypothetical protein AAB736_02900 [Patescibacteria group bacterium]
MSKIIVVSAVFKEENQVGQHKCGKCGNVFPRKELHLQDVLAISNPGHIESRFYGMPIEFNNLFVKSSCPSCKWHNQEDENLVMINCKLER